MRTAGDFCGQSALETGMLSIGRCQPRARSASLLLTLLAGALLSGCGTPGALVPHGATGETSRSVQSPSWVADVGSAALSQPVALPAGNALGQAILQVDREYDAASGRRCRVLARLDGRVLSRVVCEQASGQWYLVRPIRAAGPDGDDEPSAASSLVTAQQ